jgi:hypothetical protein
LCFILLKKAYCVVKKKKKKKKKELSERNKEALAGKAAQIALAGRPQTNLSDEAAAKVNNNVCSFFVVF